MDISRLKRQDTVTLDDPREAGAADEKIVLRRLNTVRYGDIKHQHGQTLAMCVEVATESVVSWEGYTDESGNPAECNPENIRMVAEASPLFAKNCMIAVDKMVCALLDDIRQAEKNSGGTSEA